MGNLLLGECSDFQAEPNFFERTIIGLIGFIVDVLCDDDRVIFAFLETGVDLECWNFDDPFSIQLDDALIGPSDLINVSSRYLQATHLYLILASFGAAEVFIGLQIASHEKFGLVDIGNILFSNDFLHSVERVDESKPAVVAFYNLLGLKLLDRFVEAAKMEGSIAYRT